MTATLDINMGEFRRALDRYIQTTQKSLAEIVNQRARNVAYNSLRLTPKAERLKIERELGVTSYKVVRNRKTGKIRRGAFQIANRTLAHRIVAKNLREKSAGRFPMKNAQFKREVRRFVGNRLKGVGYLSSGWLYAIRDLNPHVKFKPRPPGGVRARGGRKGWASAAKRGLVPEAIIANAIEEANRAGTNASGITRKALQHAIILEAREINRHVEEKRLQREANAFKG